MFMVMESSKIFLTLLVFMAACSILSATPINETLRSLRANNCTSIDESPKPRVHQEASFLLRHDRFLASNPRGAAMTCDKYPTVCRARESAGPHCCKKQCVNVLTDESNCGKCGNRCKYSEMCCAGKCVNPSNNRNNCGKCNNKCKKGSSCVYGLCSYAN